MKPKSHTAEIGTEKHVIPLNMTVAYKRHLEQMRELPEGTAVFFLDQSAGKFYRGYGFTARALEHNSSRIQVVTPDGKMRGFPMDELVALEDPKWTWIPDDNNVPGKPMSFTLQCKAVVRKGFDASYVLHKYPEVLSTKSK